MEGEAMRKALGPLALIALLAGIASADPYDLENGVVIAHAPPGLEYSSDLDVCAFYFEQAAIDGCAEAVVRLRVRPG
jgi:hypothetical protein